MPPKNSMIPETPSESILIKFILLGALEENKRNILTLCNSDLKFLDFLIAS